MTNEGEWRAINEYPTWCEIDYRIKPKFEKRYRYVYLNRDGEWKISNKFYSEALWEEHWGLS